MEWKSSLCGYCKAEIKSPNDAVYLFDIRGDNFFHAECYAKNLEAFARDGRFIGAGVALSGGSASSALSGLSVHNKTEDIEKIAKQGKRNDMQNSISGVSNIQLAIGIFFSLIAAFAFLNYQTIKLDLAGWIAIIIFGLIGVFGLYVSITYKLRLKEFEKLLDQQ